MKPQPFKMALMFVASVYAQAPPAKDDASGEVGQENDADDTLEVPFVQTGAFIGIVVAAAVLLLCMGCCISCSVKGKNWVAECKKEIESLTEIAETAKGKIEYKKYGEAPYAVFMNGTPGFATWTYGMEQHGFGIISISRPGYGRTPGPDHLKPAQAQADLIVALMDHLGIDKFPVIALSGGGCIAYRLAIQYPERVQCLMLQCATSGGLVSPYLGHFESGIFRFMITSPGIQRIFYNTSDEDLIAEDLASANKVKPNTITKEQCTKKAQEFAKDPYYKKVILDQRDFMKNMAVYPQSFDYIRKDLDYFAEKIPLDQVKVPVHLIHGTCDTDVDYSQSVQAHEAIPGSIFITEKDGIHSVYYNDNYREHVAQQIAFGKKHCGMEHDAEILEKKF